MMVSTSMTTRHILLALAMLLCVAKLTTGRPQNAIDNQDAPEINLNELRKLYSNYNPYASNSLDDYGLDRLQLQLLAQYAQSNAIGGAGGWDQLYRAPEMKRQIRYRQCYFNPISCFKKDKGNSATNNTFNMIFSIHTGKHAVKECYLESKLPFLFDEVKGYTVISKEAREYLERVFYFMRNCL